MARRRILFYALLALVGCAAAAGASVALAGSGGNGRRAGEGRASYREHRVSSVLARHFSIFRQQKRRARIATAQTDRSISSALSALAQGPPGQAFPLGQGLGLDPSGARTVSVTSTFSVIVVPGSAGACLLATDPSSVNVARRRARPGLVASCGPTSAVEAQGIQVTLGSADQEFVWGLVPDGNSAVSAIKTDGATINAQVSDNVYAVTGSGFRSVVFRNAAGALTTVSLPR